MHLVELSKKCHQLQSTAFKSEKTKQFSVAKISFKFGNVAAFLKREFSSVYLVFNLKIKQNF
jgi:hypothetical protein